MDSQSQGVHFFAYKLPIFKSITMPGLASPRNGSGGRLAATNEPYDQLELSIVIRWWNSLILTDFFTYNAKRFAYPKFQGRDSV